MSSSQHRHPRQVRTNLVYQTQGKRAAFVSGKDALRPLLLCDESKRLPQGNIERLLQQLRPALEPSCLYEPLAHAVRHLQLDEVDNLTVQVFLSVEGSEALDSLVNLRCAVMDADEGSLMAVRSEPEQAARMDDGSLSRPPPCSGSRG